MGRKRSKEAQRCIDAVSNALARSNHCVSNGRSSPLPFAHVQLMRGDFDLSDQRYKDAADRHGKGKVDRCNLRKMYLTACKTGKVRENISPRNHPTHRFPDSR